MNAPALAAASAAIVLALALPACAPPEPRADLPAATTPTDGTGATAATDAAERLRAEGYPQVVRSNDGSWWVGVHPDEPPPLGELHAREIAIEPADGDRSRLAEVAIEVDCTMPQHRHGMNVTPEVVRLVPGRFTVRGLELFMEGEWRFTVDVSLGETTERAEWWVVPE